MENGSSKLTVMYSGERPANDDISARMEKAHVIKLSYVPPPVEKLPFRSVSSVYGEQETSGPRK